MWVSKLSLTNIRSFVNAEIIFSRKINIIVGRNNAGKSTILRPLLALQYNDYLSNSDTRSLHRGHGEVEINLFHPDSQLFKDLRNITSLNVKMTTLNNERQYLSGNQATKFPRTLPDTEPNNFIYPFLSRRKVVTPDESVNQTTTFSITNNLRFLNAHIANLNNPEHSKNKLFTEMCDKILGFRVTPTTTESGQTTAYWINDFVNITLDNMGEGVTNLLGLIVYLCKSEPGKLFIIEEPENDLHPEALKHLLELIREKSKTNQFIITTHSNIVTKYLGAESDSMLFEVDMKFGDDKLPRSTIREIVTPEDRIKVLEKLGYELGDYDLWDGWLILEESSAQTIIETYLIPWFVKNLRPPRLKIYSASGRSKVKKRFDDFNSLFVFVYLQKEIYKNKAWVLIDGGDDEKDDINQLKEKYVKKGWREDQFLQFSKHDFEEYYPERFQLAFRTFLMGLRRGKIGIQK